MNQRLAFGLTVARSKIDGKGCFAAILYRQNQRIAEAPARLKPGGALVLEVGGSQAGDLDDVIAALPYEDAIEITDEDGDLRGLELTRRR